MGSPFASLIVSDPIPLPFDEGQWVRVRKLTGKQYEQAQAVHRAGVAVGNDKWATVFRHAAEHGVTSAALREALNDPLTGFDRHELVRLGLAAWSYERPIDDAAVADLDDDAVDFLARAVLKLAKPSLFLASVEDAEHDQKNGSGPSTEI